MIQTKILLTELILSIGSHVYAGTIIKLGFSTDPIADIELVGQELSTVDDGVGATHGDQNTEVTFLGVLGAQPAITGDNASFSLTSVALNGAPTVIGNTIIQTTNGGDFALYDQNNALLLSGTLGDGILSGPIGGTATGGFLTTEFGVFSGVIRFDFIAIVLSVFS